jgi:hypothetical protein
MKNKMEEKEDDFGLRDKLAMMVLDKLSDGTDNYFKKYMETAFPFTGQLSNDIYLTEKEIAEKRQKYMEHLISSSYKIADVIRKFRLKAFT